MSEASPKRLAFEQFALMARALGNEHRLELLDILIQGERGVERLAQASHLTINNASQHLQQLRRAGLITSRKNGTQVIYSLADFEVITLIKTLRRAAERNVAELGQVVERYYRNRDSLEPVSRDELRARLRKGSVLVLDVRPTDENVASRRFRRAKTSSPAAAARTASTPTRPSKFSGQKAFVRGAWMEDFLSGSQPACRLSDRVHRIATENSRTNRPAGMVP